MSVQILIGILINTLAFGIMGFRRNRLGIAIPKFLANEFFQILITLVYFASFFIILFSPENLIIKIVICLLMQFLMNHVLWGFLTVVIASKFFKNIKSTDLPKADT